MTLHITTTIPPLGYDRSTGNLHRRRLRFVLDGWPLLADNLRDALKEAKAMGEIVTKIEVDH